MVQRHRPIILHACGIVFVMIACSVTGALGLVLGDRTPPFIRVHGEVIPPDPVPGQEITVHWTLQGSRSCPGMVYRELIDSSNVVWNLAPTPVIFELDSNKPFIRTFRLPPQMATGRAVYRIRTEYICNPLHRWWPIETTGPPVIFNVAVPR